MRALALLLLVPLLAGCGTGGDRERNAAEAVRLEQALEEVPGVREADVEHVLDPSTPGVAQVLLVVEPRTPTRTVERAVLEALWLSRLEPLAGFRLEVQDPDGRYRRGVDPVRFAEVEDELARRYGPRPVPAR